MKLTIYDTETAAWVERTNQRLVYYIGEVNSFINIAKTRALNKDEQEIYYSRTLFGLNEVERELTAIAKALKGEGYAYPYPTAAGVAPDA